MGAKFPMHGITNHVLLRQWEPDLAKPKLTLSINMFNSLSLSWLPRLTKRTSLSMKLNSQVFGGAQGGMALAKRSGSKRKLSQRQT
jgi:hypothetical protein